MSVSPTQQFGRYVLTERLTRGGMAEIFFAKQEGPGGFSRELVVKRILPDLVSNQKFVEMFLDEARLAALLSHPNIVSVYDFGEVDGAYFIAMELVYGPSVRDLIHAMRKTSARLPMEIVAKIGAAVSEGLAYAHQLGATDQSPLKIVHRDISPSNVVVSYDGVAKILDFGIAKAASSTHHTRTGEVKGKLAYMPPEQVMGEELDGRADVYALGIILYELATLRRPFDGPSDFLLMEKIVEGKAPPPRQYLADVPAEFERIIMTAIAPDLTRRYGSARELAADLERFVLAHGGPVSTFDIAEHIKRLEHKLGTPIETLGVSKVRSGLHKAENSACPAVVPTLAAPAPLGRSAEAIAGAHSLPPTVSTSHAEARELSSKALQVKTKAAFKTRTFGIIAILMTLAAAGFATRLLWPSLRASSAIDDAQTNAGGSVSTRDDAHVDSPTDIRAYDFTDQGIVDVAHDTVVEKAPRNQPTKRNPRRQPRRQVQPDAQVKTTAVDTDQANVQSKAHLLLDTQPWTNVYLDQKLIATTPKKIELEAGKHRLVLRNDAEGIQHIFDVELKAGETQRHKLILQLGEVKILATPMSEIYVDGKKRGIAPMKPLRLPPGRHVFDVVNPNNGHRQQQNIDVVAAGRHELKADVQ